MKADEDWKEEIVESRARRCEPEIRPDGSQAWEGEWKYVLQDEVVSRGLSRSAAVHFRAVAAARKMERVRRFRRVIVGGWACSL